MNGLFRRLAPFAKAEILPRSLVRSTIRLSYSPTGIAEIIDGDGAGIGGGVGLLLTNMELQSLKLIIRHSIFPLYLYSKYYFYS